MRRQVRLLVAAFFFYSGLVGFARWWMRRKGAQLIILNYHRASNGDLRKHMLYLQRHYRVMHLDEALEELYASACKRGAALTSFNARRTPLVLTFDDGYRDNYTHAFKYACELKMPITIFLVPGYLESGDYFWWGEGARLVKYAQVDVVTMGDCTYYLHRIEDRVELSKLIDSHLRTASSVAEREEFLIMVRQILNVPNSFDSLQESEQVNLPMSWVEVKKMQESGWVSFGGHTMHHPVLSRLKDGKEVYYEIAACKEIMERNLGQTLKTFAYPIGHDEDIGVSAYKAVKKAGYSWAVTTNRGVATPRSDPYYIDRVPGDVTRQWLLMAAETSGIWYLFSPLWKPFINPNEDI